MCLFKAESVGPTFFSVDEEKEITRLEKIELEYENDFLQLLENWDSGSEWSASNKHGFNVFIKNLKGDSWKRWIKFLQDKEKYQQLAIEAIVRFKDNKRPAPSGCNWAWYKSNSIQKDTFLRPV